MVTRLQWGMGWPGYSGEFCDQATVGNVVTRLQWGIWWPGCSGECDDKDAVGNMMTRLQWGMWWPGYSGECGDQATVGNVVTRLQWGMWWPGYSGECGDQDAVGNVVTRMLWGMWWPGFSGECGDQDAVGNVVTRLQWGTWWWDCSGEHGDSILPAEAISTSSVVLKNHLSPLSQLFRRNKKCILLWCAHYDSKRMLSYLTNLVCFTYGKILNCDFSHFLSNGHSFQLWWFSCMKPVHWSQVRWFVSDKIGNYPQEEEKGFLTLMIFLPWVEWFFNMFKCDFELDDFLLWVRQFSVTCWVRWFSKWVVHAFLDMPWKNEQHQWIPWGWICIKSTKTWKWQNLDLYLFFFQTTSAIVLSFWGYTSVEFM